MNPDALPAVAIFAAAALAGWRSTLRLRRTYRAIAPVLFPRQRLVARSFVVVAFTITSAATLFGVLALRSLLGFEHREYSALLSYLASVAVLFLPAYLDRVWDQVAAG